MNTSKPFHPLVVFLLVLLLTVTGCEPAPTEVVTTPSAPVVIVTATATVIPTETSLPTDTPAPFAPKATIKIASQSPLSGDQVSSGTDIMRGTDLAVNQLADPLMKLGYEIELVHYDDQNDMSIAVEIAKEIIADPDILCSVGPYSSRVVNQVKEIYHQAGLAFISPSATAAFATASGYLEVNRVVGRHDADGAVGAQFAKTQGFTHAFVVSQDTDDAQFNAYRFSNEARRLGIEIVGNMTAEATKDFGPLIDLILEANADLVYVSTLNVQQAGVFFSEARAAGYTGAFLGNQEINSPALLEFAGPLLVDGQGMYYTSIAAAASYYPGSEKFLEDFEKTYGSPPQMFAAQAYDAAGICMEAIAEASKSRGGEIPARAEVAHAIRALQDYDGITGVYNFNENGDPNPAQYFVFQVGSTDPANWDQNPLIASFEIAPRE